MLCIISNKFISQLKTLKCTVLSSATGKYLEDQKNIHSHYHSLIMLDGIYIH